MSTRAQREVRRRYGIGKSDLYGRMGYATTHLYALARKARVFRLTASEVRNMHKLVDCLADDSVIATAYRDCERKEPNDADGVR